MIKQIFYKLILCLCLCALTSAQAGGYIIRTVKPGESLGSIANQFASNVDEIMRLNAFDSEVLQPNITIKVPLSEAVGGIAELAPNPPLGFKTHTLKHGESLFVLAENHNVSIEAIVGANPDLSSLDLLPIGLELLVPPQEGLVTILEEPKHLVELVKEYRINASKLLELNGFKSPDDIRAGGMVFLPDVEPTRALERLAKVREAENRYIWPVHGRITSYFGRRNLGMGTSRFHSAIDVAAPYGTRVVASRSGVISFAGWSNRGYGNMIKISHAGGAESWYAHHSKILVSVGQHVNQGEVIALVGSTGLSTGPHVHFEIRENNEALDPLSFLR